MKTNKAATIKLTASQVDLVTGLPGVDDDARTITTGDHRKTADKVYMVGRLTGNEKLAARICEKLRKAARKWQTA